MLNGFENAAAAVAANQAEAAVGVGANPPPPPRGHQHVISAHGFELAEWYDVEITDTQYREFEVELNQESLARMLADLGYTPSQFIRIGAGFFNKAQLKSVTILPQEAE